MRLSEGKQVPAQEPVAFNRVSSQSNLIKYEPIFDCAMEDRIAKPAVKLIDRGTAVPSSLSLSLSCYGHAGKGAAPVR